MRRAHRSYLLGLTILLVLLGNTAPPGPVAADEIECPEGLVYDSAVDMCVLLEDVEGDLTDQPVDALPPEQGQPQEAPQLEGDALPIGGLFLNNFSCPAGTSVDPAPTLDTMRLTCIEKGVAAIPFQASRDGVVVSSQLGATDDPLVDFQAGLDSPLLSGAWTVTATPPASYNPEMIVYCTVTSPSGALTTFDPIRTTGSVPMNLFEGDVGFCTWFSIEAQPRANAAPSKGLQIYFQTCPSDYNGQVDQACTLPLAVPVTVSYSHGVAGAQGSSAGQVVVTPPESAVQVVSDPAEAGDWTVQFELPPRWMGVGGLPCQTVDQAGNTKGFGPLSQGDGFVISLPPDLAVRCSYRVAEAEDIAGWVVADLHTCPEGVNPSDPSQDRNNICPARPGNAVEFIVDGVGTVEETDFRGWAKLPSSTGQWTIAVALAEGLEVSFVTCNHHHAALNQGQIIEPTINSDRRSVTFDLENEDTLNCEFYLSPMTAPGDTASGSEDVAEPGATDAGTAPDMDPGTGETGGDTSSTGTTPGSGTFGGGSGATNDADGPVAPETSNGGDTVTQPGDGSTSSLSIQHYDCDAPVADLTLDELVETCTASLNPSAWTLNGEPLAIDDAYAEWPDLEAGTVTVSNAAADGKEDTASAVYCSIATIDGVPLVGMEVPVKNGAIDLVFDQAAVIYCAWFVAP